jgi:hypothetical protein
MSNPFNTRGDDDLPVQSGSLYDVRTIPKYQDSSDDEAPVVESLYDVRTMAGAAEDDYEHNDAPLPPPPRASQRGPQPPPPPPAANPSKPPRPSLGTSGSATTLKVESSLPPPLPPNRTPAVSHQELPPPPPARRATAAMGAVTPPRRQGSGPEMDAGISQQMRSMHVAGAPSVPPPRAQAPPTPSKWWETCEQAHTYLYAPWFHKEIDRDEAEARLVRVFGQRLFLAGVSIFMQASLLLFFFTRKIYFLFCIFFLFFYPLVGGGRHV